MVVISNALVSAFSLASHVSAIFIDNRREDIESSITVHYVCLQSSSTEGKESEAVVFTS